MPFARTSHMNKSNTKVQYINCKCKYYAVFLHAKLAFSIASPKTVECKYQ